MLLHHYKRHKLIFHKDLKIFKENKMTILFNFVTKSSSKFFFLYNKECNYCKISTWAWRAGSWGPLLFRLCTVQLCSDHHLYSVVKGFRLFSITVAVHVTITLKSEQSLLRSVITSALVGGSLTYPPFIKSDKQFPIHLPKNAHRRWKWNTFLSPFQIE